MAARAEDRPGVYARVYDEFYARFGREAHGDFEADSTRAQLAFIGHFVKSPDAAFVEFGPGRCALLFEMAKRVREVVGVEASAVAFGHHDAPANARMIVAPQGRWDMPDGSADVVYSNQVLEHLHPDDCEAVVAQAFRVIRPGGLLLTLTPNRLTGPHDVSRTVPDYPEFPVAVGLHLREYDNAGMGRMMRRAGFERVQVFLGSNRTGVIAPLAVATMIEGVLEALPRSLRLNKLGRGLAGIRMAAFKPR